MKKFSIAWFVLTFLGVWVLGCDNSSIDKSQDVITIGVILPMTGELASYGDPMKIGIEMALKKVNSQQEEYNNKYQIALVDSKTDAKTAISGLQKLININQCKYIIGDVSSSNTLAMVPVAEKNKVFLISPGASSPKLRGISQFFARNYPSSVEESVSAAEFVIHELQEEQSVIIHVNNEYGLGLSDMFEKRFVELGGKVSLRESYEFEQSDFRTLITKLRNNRPKVIYLAGNQREMGKFMKQYQEVGLSATIVSNISFLEPDCINVAGSAANGVIVPIAYYNPEDSTMTGSYDFGKAYRSFYGDLPTVAVAVGFDALMLLVKAIEHIGNDPQKVASYIRNLKKYDGAMGELNFRDGDVSVPVVFKIVRDGKPVDYK